MTKREKRLQKIRQNPKNVRFNDLQAVLNDYGIKLIRSRGSHHTFSVKIDDEVHTLVIPYRRPIRIVYIRQALQLIDLMIELEQDSEEDSNDE